jgi:hypothetical protein
MPVWKSLLVILALFGLSWVGIVIGWLSWDQDRYYGNRLLSPDAVFPILLALGAGVTILVAGAIVLLQGAASLPLASAAGIIAGVITYLLARTQLRAPR